MKDLTSKTVLLNKIKSFLDITWTDTNTDNQLWDFALSSMNRLDEVAGIELDYLIDETNTYTDELFIKLSYLGKDLLFNRVFYLRQKGLDDFEKNYRSELVSLYTMGKVYANQQENE